MRLSPRYILIISAVGVFVVVLALVLLLVVPQFQRLGELDGQVREANALITQSQQLLQRRQEAKEGSAFTDAALLQLIAAVPENPDLPSLIIELQDVAYESNVQLRAIQPAELAQGDGFVSMPVDVTLWGSWTDTVDFVQRVSRLTRQVRVVQTAAEVLADSDREQAVDKLDPYAVETVLSIETYVIPASTEPAKTTPAVPPATTGQ